MNRYPIWVYITVVVALLLGTIYTVPNFYGESPAIQVSSARTTLKIDSGTLGRVEETLKKANIPFAGVFLDQTALQSSVRVRMTDVDAQLKAKEAIDRALNAGTDKDNPDYTVALNLLSRTPRWLQSLNALPMYLGLDLRGGVHFLLQVDMKEALKKRIAGLEGEIRLKLREKDIRHRGIQNDGRAITMNFADTDVRERARRLLADAMSDLQFTEGGDAQAPRLTAVLSTPAEKSAQEAALKQNLTTLSKRVNELGVAEPVVQQQGADRIVVQLPGVQDTARAKSILGRTASLEFRNVEAHLSSRSKGYDPAKIQQAVGGSIPVGTELFYSTRDGEKEPLLLSKTPLITGERLTNAAATMDQQTQRPVVSVDLDSQGGAVMRTHTRENLKARMAVLLVEKGKAEVITAPSIEGEFGNRFQITGSMNVSESTDLALLLRAGALAAPMEIIEERTVGPSLGAENIAKGKASTIGGFAAIALFMIIYYLVFGLFSVIALSANLLFLVALLSLLQATLTLPGIAAIALTLGMAIDANVLINERIREELRNGATPQAAIHAGYERAFGTIIDSNVTTLIAGLALLIFGSGPVRGFAVVHCLGILTSIFSSIVVSRALVNLTFGRQRKLEKVWIGNTAWK